MSTTLVIEPSALGTIRGSAFYGGSPSAAQLNTLYAMAREAGSSFYTSISVGQGIYNYGIPSSTYVDVWQLLAKFPLSYLEDNRLDEITLRATAALTVTAASAWTIEAYLHNWTNKGNGAPSRVDDFVPGSLISSLTRVATLDTAGLEDAADFTPTAAFLEYMDQERPSHLQVMLCSSRQRTGDRPGSVAVEPQEWVQGFAPRLVCAYSGSFQKFFSVEHYWGPPDVVSDILAFDLSQEQAATLTVRSHAPRMSVGMVRAFDFNRQFLGILDGSIRCTRSLDALDRLDVTLPFEYTVFPVDGPTTQDNRQDMLEQAWYLEYLGRWFRIASWAPDKYRNTITAIAYGAETELDRYFTNYGQVPFVMRSHTPSEIMGAVLSGQVECEWYNGSFAALDEEGFPLGWYGTKAHWTVEGAGEHIMHTTRPTTLTSEGLRLTSGAEIRPLVDVYVGSGFAGSVKVSLDWQNAFGVISRTDTFDVMPQIGWSTFVAPAWLPVRNERCVCRLRVEGNTNSTPVRFRQIRFQQLEVDTGWRYTGTMDTRDPEVAYNDGGFVRYGSWVVDHATSTIRTSDAEDTLARVFTGDIITVGFATGSGNARASIYIDGELEIGNHPVSTATFYTVENLDRHRPHLLEIVAKAGTVAVSGLTLSAENRIGVTWHRLGIYQALRALRDMIGGEMEFDTRNRLIAHELALGQNVSETSALWLREGHNIEQLAPTYEVAEIVNRCYFGGYGDGAFQIGAVIDADIVDDLGRRSQDVYGTQRFVHTNKNCGDLASAITEALQEANRNAFPRRIYAASVLDDIATLLYPGDTVRVTHSVLGGTRVLRVLSVTHASERGSAQVQLGDRPHLTSPATQFANMQRRLDQLLNTY